ncbi:hypothetical protein ISG33_11185 [Glaciecola sp. MH2013]|nr:hypothetical protein [Glaciecola sp. MH2013]
MLPGGSSIKFLRLSNKGKQNHGNSKLSKNRQHVYRIDNLTQFDIFKFGISGAALNNNGSSRRANVQVNKLNNTKKDKYSGTVLHRNLANRVVALAVELALVCSYKKANGVNPVGNKRPICNI